MSDQMILLSLGALSGTVSNMLFDNYGRGMRIFQGVIWGIIGITMMTKAVFFS